jgi:3-dehydroquinate dehydratase/shikimate dehydrogenase
VPRRPTLVQVIAQPTTDRALEAYRDAHPRADRIEIRLDLIRDLDLDRVLEAPGKPKILTMRSRAQGGRGAPAERTAIVKRLLRSRAAWIDLEPDDLALGEAKRPGGPRRILSWHDFQGTPLDLEARLEQLAQAGRADLIKMVTFAEMAADLLRVRDLLRHAPAGRVIAFCMGAKGTASRILAPAWGSAAIYAPRRGDPASAPGQVALEDLIEVYRIDSLRPATGLYGVLGQPVAQSLSPLMHNAAYEALGLDARCLPFEARTVAEFLPVLSELRLRGLSVTHPFKEGIVPHLDRLDARARRAGAVNTVVKVWNRLEGSNTDADAAVAPLRRWLDLRGARIGVLGAGGSARALLLGLSGHRCRVTLFARRPDRALGLARTFGARARPWRAARGFRCDLLVNTTPVGMAPAKGRAPVPAAWVRAPKVYDLVYNPPETVFLRRARRRGLATRGGLEMFVAQGAAQLRLFTGKRPPFRVMRRAVEGALDARR